MINVNVFDINNPYRAKLTEQMERQATAYDELIGGCHAKMGNAWDPWNQIGISWSTYNDFKNKRYSDKMIADVVMNSKKFNAIEKMKLRVKNYKSMM